MGILKDLFSKRKKRERGEVPDVYTYDQIPKKLRAQVIHILKDALGSDRTRWHGVTRTYTRIHDDLCREYGLFTLDKSARDEPNALLNFILDEDDHERVLDAIQHSFHVMEAVRSHRFDRKAEPGISPDEAIAELNERFKENGIGYEYKSGTIIRIDSEYVHSEAVRPALTLLQASDFQGANEEFLDAHEHYREGRYGEAQNEALKALESALQSICERQGWSYDEDSDTAKDLLTTVFDHNLIPSYLQSKFSALRSTLESGVPTVRNKASGHGQGPTPKPVPEYLAQYVLNMTASAIVLLVKAEQNLN